jgi:hypothetical protein
MIQACSFFRISSWNCSWQAFLIDAACTEMIGSCGVLFADILELHIWRWAKIVLTQSFLISVFLQLSIYVSLMRMLVVFLNIGYGNH